MANTGSRYLIVFGAFLWVGSLGLQGLGFDSAIASGDSFYKGKTLRIIVGYSPGGGADGQARLVARHLRKYIPGKPKVIVINRPGAGSLVAANYAYNLAKNDGLTLASLPGGLNFLQLAGAQGVKYDMSKFAAVGAWFKSNWALFLRADAYKSLDAVRKAKTPPVIGTQGGGAPHDFFNIAWQKALGLKLKVLTGYESRAVDVAIEQGEVDGRTQTVAGVLRRNPDWHKKRIVPALVQAGPKKDQRIADVPTVYDLNPNPGIFYETVNNALGRVSLPYFAPPGTPADRVKTMRDAWRRMVLDKDFIREAARSGLKVEPADGEQVAEMLNGVIRKTPPEVIATVREVLGKK